MNAVGFALVLAAAAYAAGTAPSPGPPQRAAIEVEVERAGDELLCSARAEQVSPDRFLSEVAMAASLYVEGYSPGPRSAFLTVDLARRPLAEVLEYALGSLGLRAELRANAIRVRPASPLSSREALELALRAYEDAGAAFPDHELAAAARLARGEIEQTLGNTAAALEHYRSLTESFRDSPLVPRALLLMARVLESGGEWAEASAHYRRLTEVEADGEGRDEARLGLARCAIELGDPRRALFVLDSLDLDRPAEAARDRVERALVRAKAAVALARPVDALRALAGLPRVAMDAAQHLEWLRLAAQALEGEGQNALAARAWLMASQESRGFERANALEEASRLALAAGDPLGALLSSAQADPTERTALLEQYGRSARTELDLDAGDPPDNAPLGEKLAVAENRIARGRPADAARLLGALLAAAPSPEDDELALASAERLYARAVERTRGLDAALSRLRRRRTELVSHDARREIDIEAAQLLEKHQEWERAAAAYEGSY